MGLVKATTVNCLSSTMLDGCLMVRNGQFPSIDWDGSFFLKSAASERASEAFDVYCTWLGTDESGNTEGDTRQIRRFAVLSSSQA